MPRFFGLFFEVRSGGDFCIFHGEKASFFEELLLYFTHSANFITQKSDLNAGVDSKKSCKTNQKQQKGQEVMLTNSGTK